MRRTDGSLRSELIPRFEAAWKRTDGLFSLLAPDAIHARPSRLRQPFLFYLGHLPAFAWNQVGRGVLGRPPLDGRLEALFERGIDPVGVDEVDAPDPWLWPTVPEAVAYRDRVREEIRGTFEEVERRAAGDVLAERGRVFHLVLEHEWMHHETLLYMLQELSHAKKRPPAGTATPALGIAGQTPRQMFVPAGPAVLGADFDAVTFGWDNEFPAHEVAVGAFSIDALPVTNAEFARFVEEGGYRKVAWWSPDGWVWRTRRLMEHPHSWRRIGGQFLVRTLFEDVKFDLAADWPASVSWAEADAYARWRGRRLPTEPEWHRAAHASPAGPVREHPWGDAYPAATHGNFDFRATHPTPVGTHPAGVSGYGVHDLVGDGWEWTETPFGPFDGFLPWARTYPGYSQDFFDSKHFVLLGASWATDHSMIRRSFRNWFQPHYPYVFTKFRTVARA